MKLFISFVLLFVIYSSVSGQNYFVPKYKITSLKDKEYLDLQKHKTKLNNHLISFYNNLLYRLDEIEYMDKFYGDIKSGNDTLVERKLKNDSIIIIFFKRNYVSSKSLLDFTLKYKEVIDHQDWYYGIKSIKLRQNFKRSICWSNRKELRKYNLENGDKILEIGSGNISFAKTIGRKIKNAKIYLNDIDTENLNNLYLYLQLDEKEIKKYSRKRNNEYFLIEGSEISTGVENIVFDKIIIRNTFHCFSEKKMMLESIKKSMDNNTILIISDKFEDNLDSPLKHYMIQQNFEDIMKENSLDVIYSKKMKISGRGKIWIYKFKKVIL